MAHGADLARLQLAAELEHDGGARRLAVALEQPAFRDHQMNARRLNASDRSDGARQLALERAQVIDALNEAGRRERIALVENLVADAAARRQPLPGEIHADAGEIRPRHENRLAVG